MDELVGRAAGKNRLKRRWVGRSGHARSTFPEAKLLPRERVERLLDQGSAFLEIGALAANGMYEGDVHGAGMIAGIGSRIRPRGDDRLQ